MKKKLLMVVLTVISALCLCLGISACSTDADETSKYEPVAGEFTLTQSLLRYNDLIYSRWNWNFYKNGRLTWDIIVTHQPTSYTSIETRYGTYVYVSDSDYIFFEMDGSDTVNTLLYTGRTIDNGIATFQLSGPNDEHEFAGKSALLSYYAGVGGHLQGTSTQYVSKGKSGTAVTAVAEDGYEFVRWDDGVTTATRTDTYEKGYLSAHAQFREAVDFFDLTYTVEHTGMGMIEGKANQHIPIGRNGTTVTAVPYGVYVFLNWSDGVTTASRTDLNVTEDISVYAIFGREVRIQYLTTGGGHIEGDTDQTVYTGQDCTPVTAVADDGYVFVGWSDGVTTATRHDTNISTYSLTELYARFERVYTLTYRAGAGGHIEGEANQQLIGWGQNGTAVTAVPDNGYRFVRWSDGRIGASRMDIVVNQDIDVTAEFEIDPNNPPSSTDPSNPTDPTDPSAEFAKGDGTAENPYIIVTGTQLNNISKYPAAFYMLGANITLSENFTPLFSDEVMFNGALDGNGHKIIGLSIYNTDTFYTGLFSCIGENGVVKNLILENVNVQGTNYVGAIAGYSLGTITDCTVTGKVKYIAQNSYMVYIGGIVGRAEGEVNRCHSETTITCETVGNTAYAGSIAGYLSYDGQITRMQATSNVTLTAKSNIQLYGGGMFGYLVVISLSHSVATGEVSITDGGTSYAGGIAGYVFAGRPYSNEMVTDIHASDDVSIRTQRGSAVYAGGLFGYLTLYVDFANSTAVGTVTTYSDGYSWTGGIVGYIETRDHPVIKNISSSGDVKAEQSIASRGYIDSYAGGLFGVSTAFTIYDCFASGTVTSDDCGGGLFGRIESDTTVINCYSTGFVEASYCAGGMVGRVYGNIVAKSCYTTGRISGATYIGGFVGEGFGKYYSMRISNAYTTSEIDVMGEEVAQVGSFIGYGTATLKNAHWLYRAESGVEYAVGYNESMGVPTNIGATRHTSIEEFYTLADTLNEGLDTPAWEHVGENTLPTLISKEEN